MVNDLALIALALSYAGLFAWAFRALPSDQWQFLASIPTQRTPTGAWTGANLTYYGLLTSSAVIIAVAMTIALLGALRAPLSKIALFVPFLLSVTIPAARMMARTIEGKANTFTIGGAAFVGLVAAPWLVRTINAMSADNTPPLPFIGSLAALTIAYAFGEGTGRVACISFGCCYGKAVIAGPSWWHKLFRTYHFVFRGETKKAAYEGGLENVPLIPIQAVTAIFLITTAIAGLALFLRGAFLMAFLITLFLTQSWRIVSEFFRADHRGGSRWTAYQVMALIGACYGAVIAYLASPDVPVRPDLMTGFRALWSPSVILSLQLLWLIIFVYTGRSTVTTAQISFSVQKDRV
jgi:hypothetical protein